ncbi:MAG: hypothetical protein WCW56_00600 [Candidatus Paceibacterota bacterium]|jgi:hypothetical protein
MFGTIGLIALILIFLRSFLCRAKKYNWLGWGQTSCILKPLVSLNKNHRLLGVVAILAIIAHCYYTSVNNIFLLAVLGLMVGYGLTGLGMELKFLPEKIRHWSYYVHASLWWGLILLVLVIVGHSSF